MSNANDFLIKDGILKKYTGTDLFVEIPYGVTEIKEGALISPNMVEDTAAAEEEDGEAAKPAKEGTLHKLFNGKKSKNGNSVQRYIKSLSIPETVREIYVDEGFCEIMAINVKSLTAWCSVNLIKDENNSMKAYDLYIDGTLTSELIIPQGINKIAAGAFEFCKSITSVTVPESVTVIGRKAFCGCTGLTDVSLQEGLTRIDFGAFGFCTKLKEIRLPESLKKIDSAGFLGCAELRKINIPEKVTEIGAGAFRVCYELKSINIPESVTNIGNDAFFDCESLPSAVIPESVINIGKNVFSGCCSLSWLYFRNRMFDNYIPEEYRNRYTLLGFAENYEKDRPSDEIINSYTQYLKSELYNGNASDSVQNNKKEENIIDIDFIAQHPALLRFAVCQFALTAEEAEAVLAKLPAETAPDSDEKKLLTDYINSLKNPAAAASARVSISEIEEYWKYKINGDKTVTLTKYIGKNTDVVCPASAGNTPVTEIGYLAFYKSAITSVVIADGIKCISERAFSYCESLTSVTIPGSVTELGANAFEGCKSIASVTVPDSIKRIDSCAFRSCSSLKTAYVGKDTEIADDAFRGCPDVEIIRS